MWTDCTSSWDYLPASTMTKEVSAALDRKIIEAREGKPRWTRRPGILVRTIGRVLVCVRPQPECRAQARARAAADQAYRAGAKLLGTLFDVQQPGKRLHQVDHHARSFKQALDALGAYRSVDTAGSEIMRALLRPATSGQLCRLKDGLATAQTDVPLSGRGALRPSAVGQRMGGGFLTLACLAEHIDAEIARRVTMQPLWDAATKFQAGQVVDAAACLERLASCMAMFAPKGDAQQHLVEHGMKALPDHVLRGLAKGLSTRRPLPGADTPFQQTAAALDAAMPGVATPGDLSSLRNAPLLLAVRKTLQSVMLARLEDRLPDVANILRLGQRFHDHVERSLEEAWETCEDAVRSVGADVAVPDTDAVLPARKLMLQALSMAGPSAAAVYASRMNGAMLDRMLEASATSADAVHADDAVNALRAEQARRLAADRQVDYTNLAVALDSLQLAVQARDKTAIAHGLAQIQPFRAAFTRSSTRASSPILRGMTPPDPGDDALQLHVGQVVQESVSMLHSPDDGQESIGPASLRQLSNAAIANLRRAAADGGREVVLKDEFLTPEMQSRSHAFAERVQQRLRELVHALAESPVQTQKLARVLAAATQGALDHRTRLLELGTELRGGDALAEYAIEQVDGALDGVGDEALLHASSSGALEHLANLQQALLLSLNDVAAEDTEEGLCAADPLVHELNMLSVGGKLLHAFATRLDPACAGSLPPFDNAVVAGKLGNEGLAALAAGFGIRLLAGPRSPSPLVVDRAQAQQLYEALTVVPGAPPDQLESLDLILSGGESRTIQVATQFFLDAIQRPSVSFSLLDIGQESKTIRYAPEQARSAISAPGNASSDALWQLYESAGDQAVTLTRIMNQQVAGGLMAALAALGDKSPVRLADGDCFLPGGPAHMHFDLRRQDDGSYRIGVVISFKNMSLITRLVPPGAKASSLAHAMPLVSAQSHFTARFGMVMRNDGGELNMSEPLMFDYNVVEDTTQQ